MERITLDATEVADLLGVSRGFVYELVRRNKIPHKRLMKRVVFPKEIIEKWILEVEE